MNHVVHCTIRKARASGLANVCDKVARDFQCKGHVPITHKYFQAALPASWPSALSSQDGAPPVTSPKRIRC